MDKRLELTEKQQSLVEQFEKLIQNMRNEGIGIVANMNGLLFNGLMFYNSSEVISTDTVGDTFDPNLEIEEGYSEESYSGDEADEGQIWYTPNPSDLEWVDIDIDHYYDSTFWFSVLLDKDDKEIGAFNKKHDKQMRLEEIERQLAPLIERRRKLENEYKRYVDGLTDGEENLHRLEEKGLPQDIIDEERAKIESSKKELEKVNSELNELNAEIKKIEATK